MTSRKFSNVLVWQHHLTGPVYPRRFQRIHSAAWHEADAVCHLHVHSFQTFDSELLSSG